MHILADGKDEKKAQGLRDKFRKTNKFSDIRIDEGYDDEEKLMNLLKDMKKLQQKNKFIHFDDKGYVDRTKKILRKEEDEKKYYKKIVKSKDYKINMARQKELKEFQDRRKKRKILTAKDVKDWKF